MLPSLVPGGGGWWRGSGCAGRTARPPGRKHRGGTGGTSHTPAGVEKEVRDGWSPHGGRATVGSCLLGWRCCFLCRLPRWVPLQVGIAAPRSLRSPRRGRSAPEGEAGVVLSPSQALWWMQKRRGGRIDAKGSHAPRRQQWGGCVQRSGCHPHAPKMLGATPTPGPWWMQKPIGSNVPGIIHPIIYTAA